MKNDQIIIRIDEELKERVKDVAKLEDRTLSSLIRYLLIQYLRMNESHYDNFK